MSESFPELVGYLEARRSVPARLMGEPGPSGDELAQMLTIAARVPDHGKLAPWRFIVVAADAREALADRVSALRKEREPDVAEERLAKDREALTSSPVHVAVVSSPVDSPKVPEWEQFLSAGAVCLNLIHAANALGYSAQWLTGWASLDENARDLFNLEPGEKIAGFIHIGTNDNPQTDRERPDIAALTQVWAG
ncbi:nitroreductase [Tepidamorphus sp. 3E244]|uniref:nitroreductase family protein n=1 Tax=Tepidamorphus sp. 3E244 TaxID=3385498 RepID=UPI0038FD1FED